ncbi:unnamed protein product, partial [Rotaria sp. Silwood2]
MRIVIVVTIICVSIAITLSVGLTFWRKRENTEYHSENIDRNSTTLMPFSTTQIKIEIPTVIPSEHRRNSSAANCSLPLVPVYSEDNEAISGDLNNNQWYTPVDIFLDVKNNLYVVDTENNRILKYKASSIKGKVVAGNGVGMYGTQGYPEILYPTAIFVDRNENMYIADHYIQGLYRVIFWPNNSWKGVVIINDTTSRCYGIYLDPDLNILVSEQDNHRVVKWLAPFYKNYSVIAGNGTKGTEANQLHSPRSIFLNLINGDLYVVDVGNNRTEKWSYGAEVGSTVAKDITSPLDVAVDCRNNLYIVAGTYDTVKYYGPTAITGLEGIVIIQSHNDDLSDSFYHIKAMALNPSTGDICIADSHNIVKKYMIDNFFSIGDNQTRNSTLSTTTCLMSRNATWNQTGIVLIGRSTSCGVSDDQLCHPSDLFLDMNNNIYIADTSNNRIQKYEFLNKTITTVAHYGLASPSSLFVDSDTYNLYILDYDFSTSFERHPRIQYRQKNSVTGKVLVSGTRTIFDSGVAYVSLDNDLNIYMSEYTLGHVRKWLAPYYTNSIVVAKNTTNMRPRGLFIDKNNTLYFFDDNNSQIQKWLIGATSGSTIVSHLPSTERITTDCSGNIYFSTSST